MHFRRSWRPFWGVRGICQLAVALAITGCAGVKPVVEVAVPPPSQEEVQGFLSAYRLGSGDVITVSVFGEPDLSHANLRLSDSGTVFLPTIGELGISGLTLGEVERRVANRLRGRILVNPKVSVTVEQYRPFFINGMVKGPGAYPYQPGLTVRKATSLAGGLHERASTRKIFVIRAEDPTLTPQRIDMDTALLPGDVVTIEESFF